jgi:hypothetical protein
MRSALVALLTLLAVVGMAAGGTRNSAAAPRQGTVSLTGLPPGAHVYVDGKKVRPREGALRLEPGIHELQVEAPEPPGADRVVAMRQTVEVRAGEKVVVEVRLVPVYALRDDPQLLLGPTPQGPPGLPARGFVAPPDLPAQTRLVKEGLLAFLHFLSKEMDEVETFHARVPTFYWFPPADAETVARGMHPFRVIAPRGAMGASGDVFLIQDTEGRPVVEAAKAHFGVPALEQSVMTAVKESLVKPFTPWRIRIYTPELRKRLDRQFGRHVWLPPVLGPPGRPGEFTAVPPEARPPRLGPEEVAALLTRLEQDADLKARIDALRRRIADR